MTVFPDSLADLHAYLEAVRAECQRLPQEAALRRKLEVALWELQDCERCRQQRLALGELPNGIYRLRALRSYIAHLQAQAERAARCPRSLPNGVTKNADENRHTRD